VDCIDGPDRFSNVKLADLGNAVDISPDMNTEGHTIGSAFFRSPEALLGMQWTQATDIWSFGTLVSIRCLSTYKVLTFRLTDLIILAV
jgi:serine/threonine protein kinase